MAPQFVNEATTSDRNIKVPVLKATPKLRAAFDNLVFPESFLESSEYILRFVSSCLPTNQNKEALPEDVKYVFKRLISGLASQRELARHGCYTTLQALLQLHTEGLPFAIFYIDEYYTKNDDEVSNINHILGHVLACGAVIRCGYASEDKRVVKAILKKLLVFRQAKSYMEPVVAQFLINLVVMYKDKDIIHMIWEEINEKIQEKLDLPLSLLWLRIILTRDEYVEAISNVQPDFQSETYSTSAFKIIASKFKELFEDDVNATPMVEDYLKSLALLRPRADTEGADNVALFFFEAIHSFLVKEDIEDADIIFTFNMAQMALPYLKTKDHVGKVLGTKLMEEVVSKFKSKSITGSARGLMSAVLQLIINKEKEDEDEVQFLIVKSLISTSASLRFDSVTGSTLLEQASNHFSEATIKGFAKLLTKMLAEKETSPSMSYYVNEVIPIVQWLSRLICHPNMKKRENIKWKSKLISLLLVFTFFKDHSKASQLRLKDFYLRALNAPAKKLEDQVSLIEGIVEKVYVWLLKSSSSCSLDEESRSCFETVRHSMQRLGGRGDEDANKDLVVFRLLYGHMILNLFIHPESSFEFIKEIDECCAKVLAANEEESSSSKKKSPSNKKSKKANTPAWVDVVLDMLLGIMSKEQSYWKKIACNIFRYICHSLSPGSLVLLTDVLNPDKNEEILFNADKEEEEEEAEEDDDASQGDEEEGWDEDVDDEDEEEEEEEEEEAVDDSDIMKMKMEMQKLAGDVSETVELDSVPAEELDRMDRQFGAIFRQFRAMKNQRIKERKELSKDGTALMNFRIRVCDLLIVLVKEKPSFDHLVPLMSTLLDAIKGGIITKSQPELVSKCRFVLRELSQVKEINNPVAATDLVKQLESLFDVCQEYPEEMKGDVSDCFAFLFHCASHVSSKKVDGASQEENKQDGNGEELMFRAYAGQLERMLKRDWCVDSPLQMQSKFLYVVFDKLCDIVFNDSTKFHKQRKGLEMIKLIFRNKFITTFPPQTHEKLIKNITRRLDSVHELGNINITFLLSIIDLLKILKRFHNRNKELKINLNPVEDSVYGFVSRVPLNRNKVLRRSLMGLTSVLKISLNWNEVTRTTDHEWVFNDMVILKKKRTEESVGQQETPLKGLNQDSEPAHKTKKEKKNKKEKKKIEQEKESAEDLSQIPNTKKRKRDKKKKEEDESEEPLVKKSKKRRKIQETRVEGNKKRFRKLAAPELEGFRFSDFAYEEKLNQGPEDMDEGEA